MSSRKTLRKTGGTSRQASQANPMGIAPATARSKSAVGNTSVSGGRDRTRRGSSASRKVSPSATNVKTSIMKLGGVLEVRHPKSEKVINARNKATKDRENALVARKIAVELRLRAVDTREKANTTLVSRIVDASATNYKTTSKGVMNVSNSRNPERADRAERMASVAEEDANKTEKVANESEERASNLERDLN